VKQTKIRINRLELRLRGGAAPGAAEVARKIAEQLALHRGEPLPKALEATLAHRLTAPLAGVRRK